jgi:hypothetical protein
MARPRVLTRSVAFCGNGDKALDPAAAPRSLGRWLARREQELQVRLARELVNRCRLTHHERTSTTAAKERAAQRRRPHEHKPVDRREGCERENPQIRAKGKGNPPPRGGLGSSMEGEIRGAPKGRKRALGTALRPPLEGMKG